jgi:hypothetical protein
MRPQALTRKNALFAGHDDGAEKWAILASLIETAKTQWHRSPSLAHRYPRPPRQSLAQQSTSARKSSQHPTGAEAPLTDILAHRIIASSRSM